PHLWRRSRGWAQVRNSRDRTAERDGRRRSMTRFVITGGSVVTEDGVVEADVVVDGGLISELARPGTVAMVTEVDASGLIVLPGGVDAHTHMDSPSGGGHTTDTHDSGTRAAAAGGT